MVRLWPKHHIVVYAASNYDAILVARMTNNTIPKKIEAGVAGDARSILGVRSWMAAAPVANGRAHLLIKAKPSKLNISENEQRTLRELSQNVKTSHSKDQKHRLVSHFATDKTGFSLTRLTPSPSFASDFHVRRGPGSA
ncbi:unnamed protein product [Nezara viridula]|uniref:Uncharacterized protein n=1 Tax=Nezara viridula TaxID=85310 RepID=A0A9P0MU94_NEZVI|nr:unnamed protein product [Nezara viridula]